MGIPRLRTALFGLLIAAPIVRAQAPQATPAPAQEPVKPTVAQDTPEAAFKTFFVAMATGDEEVLKKVTLPAEGFEWLLKGQRVPPEHTEAFRKAIRDTMVLKRLKAGEEVKLPNGQVVKIEPERVTEDRAVLLPEGAPITTDAYRVMGVWKIDARPMIAGRKAADAARRRAEDARKKAGN